MYCNIETDILPPVPPKILSIINPDDINNNNNKDVDNKLNTPSTPTRDIIPILEQTKFKEGEFLYITNIYTREMLVNAWKSITQLNLWNYMKKNNNSFMFTDDIEVKMISDRMEELGYSGHSGYSFGWTMRQMQFIARYGELEYVKMI